MTRQMYVDSSLVRANLSGKQLSPSGMTVDEFKEKAVEENDLLVVREQHPGMDAKEESVSYYQDPKGRLPLSPVDTDAGWRTSRNDRRSHLHYQENIIVDGGGFILSRQATHASEGEWKAVKGMLTHLPIKPESLAADTAYNAGRLRKHLEDMNITAHIPIHPNHAKNMVSKGGFTYRGDHLLCPMGKRLSRGAFHKRDGIFQYVARQRDCQACPVKGECLPPPQKRRFVSLSMYHPVFLRAREHNESEVYRREMKRRQTKVEGVFASLDRLGWARSRLRSLWKVNCEGYISALAHNLKKAAVRLGAPAVPSVPRPASEPVSVGIGQHPGQRMVLSTDLLS